MKQIMYQNQKDIKELLAFLKKRDPVLGNGLHFICRINYLLSIYQPLNSNEYE